jgi:2-polyprenyl-3-methyl-5-hydroxy-6-metoxy-1,4-benzoquinol methylase
MSKQNIFNNEEFFNGYSELRRDPNNANDLIVEPVIFSLLPDLRGKKILDLGCGSGGYCKKFSIMGADSVVGIDISSRMLGIANKENKDTNIEYYEMGMEELQDLNGKYDIAVSSMALHYIADLDALLKTIYCILNNDGLFIFSQEHPLTTAPLDGAKWIRDENGRIDHYRLADYARSGERHTHWFIDDVIKYHRTFSEICNSLISAGFIIRKVLEPVADKELPKSERDRHKPDFLFIKSSKSDT